ncbi:MAG: tetratricopeptide repeat protein [Clostridia bacterium]|nr:tetratricopeptide repeat protein [Clostridia bacterium]NCC42853.1 tetratricopeptide repeat protein [Clostridia bacterium]
MNCMNCGAPLNKSAYCPSCGFNVEVQKRVWQLSNLYYNQGLEKAEIRDLSGAIDLLKRSLKFNKLNIQARNLLGLVYFETGEAVAALSEWVISKNIMPENNIASEYINQLQENANKLDVINQTIKKYNDCLLCCRRGSEDVAVIQLKKILNQNPKLIKGYHLLALIYLKQEEYEKARRILKKAAKIDKTNSTTLRFLKEVDEQTGTMTSLEPRRWGFGLKDKGGPERGQSVAYMADNEMVIQPPTFRETSMAATLLNLGFGFLVGACLVWFLTVPANTQRINREANEKVVTYSNTMASQAAELTRMEEQITQSEETVTSAQAQIEQAASQVTTYENLIKAYAAYQGGNYTSAASVLQNVDSTLLSVEAKEIYDSIYNNIKTTMQSNLKNEGEQAFYGGDYPAAIEALSQALEMDDTNYEVLNLLAHSYRLNGDLDKAVETFQMIVDKFPGTKRASNAQRYIDNGGEGFDNVGQSNTTTGTGGTAGTDETTGTDETGQAEDTTGTGDTGTAEGTNGTTGTGEGQ